MLYLYATAITLGAHTTDAVNDRLDHLRRNRDRGASLLEYVIIAGVVCVLAVGLGVLITKVVGKHEKKIK